MSIKTNFNEIAQPLLNTEQSGKSCLSKFSENHPEIARAIGLGFLGVITVTGLIIGNLIHPGVVGTFAGLAAGAALGVLVLYLISPNTAAEVKDQAQKVKEKAFGFFGIDDKQL
jgi:hypothetical protein